MGVSALGLAVDERLGLKGMGSLWGVAPGE